MVGPGEVDEELEPEVKEECEGKYGEIIKVKIKEMPGVVEEEAVRIFLEFKHQKVINRSQLRFERYPNVNKLFLNMWGEQNPSRQFY